MFPKQRLWNIRRKRESKTNKESCGRFAQPRCWLAALEKVLVVFNRRTSISGKVVSRAFEGLFLKPDSPEQRETLLHFAELRDESRNFEAGEGGNHSAGVDQPWCNNLPPTVSPVAGVPVHFDLNQNSQFDSVYSSLTSHALSQSSRGLHF